jgi:peptidoglycan/xylan/chitin deacetylase (PgdA/CDA1 family)
MTLNAHAVSIVMPAHNAGATINDSIDSVVRQIFQRWELIVVDDGSRDDTAAKVDRRAAQDPRIRRISQPKGGVSSARNLGTASAHYHWTLYLDADDWLAPTHLQRMTDALAANPQLDAVHCGSVRIAPDGTRVDEQYCPPFEDLFEQFTRFCAFPVHACIFRRLLVAAVGGWDSSLRTCEDWDFWQRIARTRARFGAVRECLALYRMRPGSASLDGFRYMTDGLRVVHQAYRRDARVWDPNPAHAAGASKDLLPNAVFSFLCWPAGLILGAGGDARPLLDMIDVGYDRTLDYRHVAGCILHSALLPGAHRPSDWDGLWPTIEPRLEAFLQELERRSGAEGIARRSRALMERNIIERAPVSSRLRIGRMQSIEVDVTDPLRDMTFHPDVERLRCVVHLEGERLNVMYLPVSDGSISRDSLCDAIAHEFSWIILGKFFHRTVYRELRITTNGTSSAVWRGNLCLADGLGENNVLEQVHDHAGWLVFLQELWGRPEWPLSALYDERPHDPGTTVRAGRERIVIEISEELPDLVSDGDIQLDIQMGGMSLGWMTVRTMNRCALRMRIIRAIGRDLYRVAVGRALVGAPLVSGGTLRERLRGAADATRHRHGHSGSTSYDAAVRALHPSGGVVLTRRRLGAIGTSATSHTMFPSVAEQDLVAAAESRGDTVIHVPINGTAPRVVYAPEVITDRSAPLALPVRPKSIAHESPPVSLSVPILMYHRIAETSCTKSAPYCLPPTKFEAQLQLLRDRGFCSVTLEEWRVAWENRQPFRQSPVIMTFDDGYRDFSETAWPLLKRYGFSALLFVVTGEVGATNRWDVIQYGVESIPLLDWSDLRRLRDDGVEFGSHSVSHPRLTGMSQMQVIREATRSQMELQRELGQTVLAFSYPYGDLDEFVRHWIGACGYTFGVTCRPGRATHQDRLLALPRIEVTSEDTLETFAEKLGI